MAKGYPSPNLTHEQLADIQDDARTIVSHLVAFNSGYQDATDYLVRGEADLAIGGWEAMVNWAKDKDTTLDFGFFKEAHGGGWSDSLAIPTNAVDIDAAYAYIDAMISPTTNAQIATNLISGTVNSESVPMVDPSALIYDYEHRGVDHEPHQVRGLEPAPGGHRRHRHQGRLGRGLGRDPRRLTRSPGAIEQRSRHAPGWGTWRDTGSDDGCRRGRGRGGDGASSQRTPWRRPCSTSSRSSWDPWWSSWCSACSRSGTSSGCRS